MLRLPFALAALAVLPIAACAQPSGTPGAPSTGDSATAPRPRTAGGTVAPDAGASVAAPNIAWHASFLDATAAARTSGKKVLAEVWAPWCGYCRKMQREVYPSADVQAAIEQYFEPVRVNGEIATDSIPLMGMTVTSQMLAGALGAQGYPTTAFLMPDGRKITHLPGYSPAEDFALVLRYIGSDAYRDETFETWRAKQPGVAPASTTPTGG